MKKKKTVMTNPGIRTMSQYLLLTCLLLAARSAAAGDTLRVLFVGNSYIYTNDLPDVVQKLARAGGDSLYYQSSTVGGMSMQQHLTHMPTVNLITQGGWDYVVLQDQSQRPSFPDGQVANQVYPYAKKLDSLIHKFSPCAKTVFYMTWGRKFGDVDNCPIFPPVCTYQGMDSLLQLRYSIMAEQNHAMISPVAKVWRRLRNTTGAPELYQSDSSHPVPAGTYAAALSFHTVFFGKNPESTTYNFSLTAAQAAMIKAAAKAVVYDSLPYWKRFYPLPAVDSVAYTRTGTTFQFSAPNPRYVLGYSWNFGDGTPVSTQAGPTHTFAQNGNHNVCLTLYGTCDTVTLCRTVTSGTTGIAGPDPLQDVALYPNPVTNQVQLSGLQTRTGFTLTNLAGATLISGSLANNESRIDLSACAKGVYFLKLQAGSGAVKVLKLVKQ